jgi:esterase/lipase
VESWRAPNQVSVSPCVGEEAIVLLHGFAGTPRMLSPLRTYLRNELDRPTLDLALGIGLGDIRDTAIRVHEAMVQSGVRHCDVIGYSLGGLVPLISRSASTRAIASAASSPWARRIEA